MSAMKRLTDVTKTAIMLLVHMPVVATEDIVLGKIESLALV
jgi:Mg-chelatase subunit ChlI